MKTLGLLVTLNLVTLGLVGSASVWRTDEQTTIDPAAVNLAGNLAPHAAENSASCRFCQCRLPPNPRAEDLIKHRLCIKRILEREGGTDVGGRWGRSVHDFRLRRNRKFEEHARFRREAVALTTEDVDALLQNEVNGRHRLPRSLEALCAGDLNHYGREVRDYISWRCKNGYGQLMRRWGRSSPGSSADTSRQAAPPQPSPPQGGATVARGRAKRDDADELRALVEAYREWRSQNGYGQSGGRWG